MNKIILFSGGTAVGKTSVIKWILRMLMNKEVKASICKIDCLFTEDQKIYEKLGYECLVGLSGDICPDHYLVSNLPELWQYCQNKESDWLFIESAGLCHRCSPATEKMIAGCVLDATASYRSPEGHGPMLLAADFIVLTKIDMISQAEKEILIWKLKKLNKNAVIFPIDALVGYGIDVLLMWLLKQKDQLDFVDDQLRHSMPAGVCSYCVGETRVGAAYQQGVISKIEI